MKVIPIASMAATALLLLIPVGLSLSSWPIMSGFVSVGYTPQTTDICVCRRHVDNVGPTGRRHSVKSAHFFADKIVSGNSIPDTILYVFMYEV